MEHSRIIANEDTGNKCLYVFYDRGFSDWEKRIAQACRNHKIKRGSMPVICFPEPIETSTKPR